MSDPQAALTPMADHIKRFWRILANEHVRILVDTRHEGNVGVVYFRSSSFPDDVAKALVGDRAQLERELAEARAETERWAEQALKEEDCRKMWQAERDRLAAEVERLKAEVKRLYRPAHFID